jgi:Xaa-Pro aminopeptidase
MNQVNTSTLEANLLKAQSQAEDLFGKIIERGLIQPGITERQLSDSVHALAQELFGIKRYWHKRIVRAGINTIHPYRENPPNLIIQDDDIVFFDFGPVFEEYEADLGRSYLLGNNAHKQQMLDDLEPVFKEAKTYFHKNPSITGGNFFRHVVKLTEHRGWCYGGPHAGHLVGNFPHEKLLGDEIENYIHPENKQPMDALDKHGQLRHWILEIHLVDKNRQYGGFYEDILRLDRAL